MQVQLADMGQHALLDVRIRQGQAEQDQFPFSQILSGLSPQTESAGDKDQHLRVEAIQIGLQFAIRHKQGAITRNSYRL